MTKEALRKLYMRKRISLSDAEYALLNFQICQNFFANIDLSFINLLHTFLPLKKNKEPDTWLIVDRIQKEFPNVRITIPRVNNETARLENFIFEDLHQLQENQWGIPEPKNGTRIDNSKIDIVLVPLLICDNQGHRVGYGKGFYDKFLPTCSQECKLVGISLFEPIERIADLNAFDVPVQYCLTPTALHSF